MFNVNEVKSWAKARGMTIKKKDDGYVWFAEGEEPSDPKCIDDVVKEIYNRVTGGKWVEHQNGVTKDATI